MTLETFKKIANPSFNKYFQYVEELILANRFQTSVINPIPSFPQTIICTELPNHFALELIGGRRHGRSLRAIKRKLDREDVWFGQFSSAQSNIPMMHFTGSACITENLALIPSQAKEEINRRFPGIINFYPTKLQIAHPDMNVPIMIEPSSSYIDLRNLLLVSSNQSLVRIRHIRYGLIINKMSSEKKFRAYLNKLLTIELGHSPIGFTFLSEGIEEKFHLAAQFANLYLMDKLHETSLGSFISDHDEIILGALNGKRLISEPYIKWQIPSPDPKEIAINPDIFIQRQDGYYDIYDLKLPLLDSSDITTGKRKRRRFKLSVEDGIAQLAHYRDFLSIPENRLGAEKLYGVKFKKPRFGLIVGNYENTNPTKIAEAKRRLGNFEIIDYDTLLQLYLAHNKANTTSIGVEHNHASST